MCVKLSCPLLSTVPGAPVPLILSARSDITPVGIVASWGAVLSATSYSIRVVGLRLGEEYNHSSIVPSYIITSEAVGGYEMVSVEVIAVNEAGYGPPSDPAVGRTPSISMRVFLCVMYIFMSSPPPPVPGEVRGISFTGLGGDVCECPGRGQTIPMVSSVATGSLWSTMSTIVATFIQQSLTMKHCQWLFSIVH